MTQLIDQGKVRRGMLGVTIQPVTSDIARSLGLSQVRGALVNSVCSRKPGRQGRRAARRRDHGGQRRDGPDGNELRNEVSQLLPGTATKLSIVRDGKEQTVNVTVAEREDGLRPNRKIATDIGQPHRVWHDGRAADA